MSVLLLSGQLMIGQLMSELPVQLMPCCGPAVASGRPVVAHADSGRALGVWAVGGISPVGVQWQAAAPQIDPVEPHWHQGVFQVQEELHLLHAAVVLRSLHQMPGALLLEAAERL